MFRLGHWGSRGLGHGNLAIPLGFSGSLNEDPAIASAIQASMGSAEPRGFVNRQRVSTVRTPAASVPHR